MTKYQNSNALTIVSSVEFGCYGTRNERYSSKRVTSNDVHKFNSMHYIVEIHSDGACRGNPGPGGWGAVLQYGDKIKYINGYELNTTNNRMEMRAAIEALKCLKYSCQINLYTDSTYLQKGITNWIYQWQANNWLKADNKPVKNVDLWQELYTQIQKHKINWHWVKGHATNQGNIMADKLAVDAKNIAIGKANAVSE